VLSAGTGSTSPTAPSAIEAAVIGDRQDPYADGRAVMERAY
jgi:hypothetical protein